MIWGPFLDLKVKRLDAAKEVEDVGYQISHLIQITNKELYLNVVEPPRVETVSDFSWSVFYFLPVKEMQCRLDSILQPVKVLDSSKCTSPINFLVKNTPCWFVVYQPPKNEPSRINPIKKTHTFLWLLTTNYALFDLVSSPF